ncbi:recombinase family protein [Nostoc sp. FACHB-110]|nr:recombinase family protein [Nostoc sp. FACHB-110]MBD2440241.1 recombinase family protein [Nostoc sp. FACHB-110]
MNSQDKIAKIPEVVAYARVSSREQAENSAALDQQIARLKAAGAEIVLTDTESGREGKEDQRSNFQKLMQWVRGGLVKQVIITRLDRLSRSLPTLRKVLNEFQKSNTSPILTRIYLLNNTVANLRGFKACRNGMNTSQRSKLGKNLI